MERTATDVVLKYCPPLDCFVRLRRFTAGDIARLLAVDHGAFRGGDGRAYRQLVVNACVVAYGDEVLPRAREMGIDMVAQVEEHLYQSCVELNPGLEISKVVLPVSDSERGGELHLLDAPAAAPAEETWALPVRDLEPALSSDVIGQDEAIRRIVGALKRSAAGLREPDRPIGSFFFVGQTGVGKTELARSLARRLFRDPSHLVRIDCAEYASSHEYAKLIGAPPGYVGHGEGGVLTERVKRLDGAVVLFDEVEKADRKLHHLLLRLLDEGSITDGKGEEVSGRRVVIVLTSNIGTAEAEALRRRIGFPASEGTSDAPTGEAARREAIMQAMRLAFPPEFINRLDEVICFAQLSVDDCARIVDGLLARVAALADRRGIRVRYSRPLTRHLAERGYDADYGARHLKRVVRKEVEAPLAERIVAGDIGRGDEVRLGLRRDRVVIRRVS